MDPKRRATISPGLLLAGLMAAAAGAACSSDEATARQKPTAASAQAVSVVKATVSDLESAIEVSGNLVPQLRVDLRPTFGGTLEGVRVNIGDHVSAGATLATLDRREIDAQVDAAVAAIGVARASLEAAEAGLTNARQEIDRARNLFDKGALPRQRLDAADTAFRAARAERDLAQANVAQAEAAGRRAREVQRDATLRAPMAGVIVERNYDAGNLVGPGSDLPVVAIADMRVLKLEAGVSELDAGRLRVGMPAAVTVSARPGERFEGRLAAIAPEVDRRNRHFRIEVRVPNAGANLLSGMYAAARIVVDRAAAAVVVPRTAVFARSGTAHVFKVSGDVVSAVLVTQGLSDGSRVQIASGLAPGDVIVADARREVAEGTKVRPVRAD
jgi:RND family efflux transporter MFP subunit